MPEISRFPGIVVRMYYRDHSPAHFHASYGEFQIVVQIETGAVEGCFPPPSPASRARVGVSPAAGTHGRLESGSGSPTPEADPPTGVT